jgi:hypothetical protein
LELICHTFQALAVFNGSSWVVDTAWADHDEETVVFLRDDFDTFSAATDGGLQRFFGSWQFGGQEGWWNERVIAEN